MVMAKKAKSVKSKSKKALRSTGGVKGRTVKKAAKAKIGSKTAKQGKASKSTSAGGGSAGTGPASVSTGKGLSPLEIGLDLVAKFNSGKAGLDDIGHFSKDLVSCEGLGVGMEWRGRRAVDEKNAWWMQEHIMHGGSAEGPFVGSTGFAVRFTMDVETKSSGARESMEEIGVYTVRDGKIVREEFMYLAPSR